MHCQRRYTPTPKHHGYPNSLRKQAAEMYVDGGNLRRIARHLKVSPQTASLWMTDVAKALPNAPVPEEVKEAEMNEIFTFIGDKKNGTYILTVVERKTGCVLGWAVIWVRAQEAIQDVVDQAPNAKQYYSDSFDACQWLWCHFGRHEISKGKADTYSVEVDNAELRHYLARLARKSRCFSRCPYAFECALRIFVFAFNNRQLHKQRFPNYAAHVMDFVSP